MKVLYIVGGNGKQNGSEIIAMSILKCLSQEKKVQYTVVTAKDGCVNQLCKELGIENYALRMKFYVYSANGFFILRCIKRMIRNLQADYAAARAFMKLRKLVQLNTYDLIHTNLSRDLLGGFIGEKYNIPHIWHLQELFEGHYGVNLLKKDQISWMNMRTEAYIAVSEHVAADWIRHGLEREKVNVILNGIVLSNIKEKDWSIKKDTIKIVMVGELCEPKGQIYLLEAVNRIRKNRSADIKINVDFYGEGKIEYTSFLKHKTEEYQLENVISFKGYCNNIHNILDNYDIAVNCSRGEGFGLSTIEFMACGLCVVAADTGANTEIIEDRVNGIIFNYENAVEELCAVITDLAKSRELMMTLGMKAKDIKEKYKLRNMCDQVFQLYRKVTR